MKPGLTDRINEAHGRVEATLGFDSDLSQDVRATLEEVAETFAQVLGSSEAQTAAAESVQEFVLSGTTRCGSVLRVKALDVNDALGRVAYGSVELNLADVRAETFEWDGDVVSPLPPIPKDVLDSTE